MSKISNILSILTILSSGRKYTAKELSNLIEVSPRQIRTYIEDLEKSGIYVDVIKGRYGGYYYQTNDFDFKMMFTINEVNTLEKLYMFSKNKIKEDKLLDRLSLIIEKMRYVVLYSNNSNNVVSEEENKKMYNILSNAIYNNLEIKIIVKKNRKSRMFTPHSIYVNKNIYYVTGYCSDINAIRTYPFSEIIEIICLK